jgi:phosphate starvation-inducible protein PhoH and related proteins
LFLKTDDESVWVTFKTMIRSLEDRLKRGEELSPSLVQALYGALRNGETDTVAALTETGIILPRVNRKVFPKSPNQAAYIRALKDSEMVFGIGPAGTGKTYLAVAHALAVVLSRQRRKLILTRPIVEAGESLGFLPGDLGQKISPYLRPLYDAMEYLLGPEMVRSLEDNRILEVAPLAYMRGRTLSECVVILDEAQNTSREQMKMFLTRIGMGTQAIITGDITQIDLPRRNDSGLVHVASILKAVEPIRFLFFAEGDVVRNPIVKKIIHAYETHGR